MTITNKDIKWMKFCISGATLFSTCSKRQYFSIILDSQGHVLGTGYNGGPKNTVHCNEGGCPRAIENSKSGSSYDNCIAIHAEQNALLHSNYSDRIAGSTLYVNGPPCYTCAKLIINSGITRIVHTYDDSYVYEQWPEIKKLIKTSGIELHSIDINDI